jgi:hypothetical protein
MNNFVLFSLNPPVKWQAGLSGDVPFYFNCCKCGAEGPEIAGICARNVPSPQFSDIGVVGDGPCNYKPAMYCAACYPAELEAGKRRMAEASTS